MDPSTDERRWAAVAHAAVPFTGCLGPLLIWSWRRGRSRYVDEQLSEALGWSVVVSALALVSAVLVAVVLGTVLLPLVWFVAVVLGGLGASAAHRGQVFRYPVTWRLIP